MNNCSNEVLQKRLSNAVSPLIGHTIDKEHIYVDEGWDFYIREHSLIKRHPLILDHYRGHLLMIIPVDDWKELENGTISVIEYVNSSHWYYGYYWGGDSLLYGVYWQPFEEKGIHDTLRIASYLETLRCRTLRRSSGRTPTSGQCDECWLESCSFSRSPDKRRKAKDEDRLERDARKEIFSLIKERISTKTDFKATSCLAHENSDGIWLLPNIEDNTVTVYLPEKLLVDLLYHPEEYDINGIVDAWDFKIDDPRAPKKKTSLFEKIFRRH